MPFVLYLLALAVFVMGTSEFMLAGLIRSIATDLDVTIGTSGLLTSAFAAGMVIGAPLMAASARRWPPRRTLTTCLVVFAGCHVIAAITPTFWLLLVTRVLSALANAGFLAVALSTAVALVPANRKGRAVSVLLGGTTIATVAGVPAGALLGAAMGWRATFWAIAVLCIPAIVGVIRGVATASDAIAPHAAVPRLREELGLLVSGQLVRPMALGALVNGGTFAAFTFLAPIVTDVAGLAEGWVPIALVLFGVGSFLGVAIAGRLPDQWSGLVLAVGGPLLAAGWTGLAFVAAHPMPLLALVLVQGALSFGVGSTLITGVLYAAARAPTMGGSYATAALNLGATAGPILGGLALATSAGLLAPVWVAAVLTAVASVSLVRGRDVRVGDQ